MNVKFRGNEYAAKLGKLLEECPKNVLAAIAVSVLSSGGDYLDLAAQRVAKEWDILHENGIVPQKPTKRAVSLASLEKDWDEQ